METRYEHRYANKYIKLVCKGQYSNQVTVREIFCHIDQFGNIIEDADLGATKIPLNVWECAAKSIECATRLPFSEDEIFIFEKVEEFDSCFKITLNKLQANFFANKGIKVFCFQMQSEIMNMTIDNYFAIVTSDELLKILPRR
jgi:hypothetical protein